MKLKSRELGLIELSTKDTDLLVITFKDEYEKPFAQIRLRGMESDAVIKRIKTIERASRQ